MATDLQTILSWFRTGLKPTQTQFWASWSSFWHKDEAIPQSSVSGLTNVLNAKVENDQFNAHKVDNNAHPELFAKIRFIPYGELLVFEPSGKTTPGVLAVGDYCQGYVEGEFINANYMGGDKTLLSSYDLNLIPS